MQQLEHNSFMSSAATEHGHHLGGVMPSACEAATIVDKRYYLSGEVGALTRTTPREDADSRDWFHGATPKC
jgi:hypothetical protein